MKIKIDTALANTTIKKYLFDCLKLSRGTITALKKREDGIRINGEHKTVRYVMQSGDELELNISDDSPSEKIKVSDGSVDIIYEDEHILAVNKPSNLAVHPSKKIQDDTLAGRILSIYKPMVFRAMGRLDKDTSGVVILSKDRMTAGKLYDEIKSRRVHKEYILITEGKTLPESGEIELGIIRDDVSFIKRTCIPIDKAAESEKAKTVFTKIAQKGEYALIKASPVTGRTHQLRAHFSFIGSPLIGDTLYGKESPFIERQALHAYKISFVHPYTNKPIEICAPLHDDMKKAIAEIFGAETQNLP